MTTTMKAFHLGPNRIANLEVYRNTKFEELKNLFDISQRLIFEHEAEILNVTMIDWTSPSWASSTLAHDEVIRWTTTQTKNVSTQSPYYA